MKKLKLMALFLSATLAFSAIIPVPVLAIDETETGDKEERHNAINFNFFMYSSSFY